MQDNSMAVRPTDQPNRFRFVDLFAGVGGFHAAGSALSGKCVLAAEIDTHAAGVYEANWGLSPVSDVRELAANPCEVPDHDLLFAGFPCQPFSKSGKQHGEREDRGNLFYSIVDIVQEKQPAIIMLENVRNLAGPKHRDTLATITQLLEDANYALDHTPVVVSPHEIHPDEGGKPQARERVYILAIRRDLLKHSDHFTFAKRHVFQDLSSWNKHDWDFEEHVAKALGSPSQENLTADELLALEMWEDFLIRLRANGETKLSGFPIWSRYFTTDQTPEEPEFPKWKQNFVNKNRSLYLNNQSVIDDWLATWRDAVTGLPPSKLKFEWQAQDLRTIWDGAIQFRPSGVRVKKASYLPALVAIAQTSIIGRQKRRISVPEVADLQGFPSTFSFGPQSNALSYKQMGNAVNVGTVYQVLRAFARTVVPYLNDEPNTDLVRKLAEETKIIDTRKFPTAQEF